MKFVLDPMSPTGISKAPTTQGYNPYFAGGAPKVSLVDSVAGKHGAVRLNLDDLDDVVIGTPSDNQALAWDDATGKFIPQSVASIGGVSEAFVIAMAVAL